MPLASALRGCLGTGVVFVEPGAHAVTFTAAAVRLLRLPAASAPHQAWELLPAPLQQLATDTLKAGVPFEHQTFEWPAAPAPPLALDVNAYPVGREGGSTGVVLVVADRQALRQCEERLQRLDRLANLGTLAASMAHEIKNALVAGKTFIDLLLEKNPAAELTDVVRRELARIDAIVARLLKFGGPTRVQFTDLRAHDLLDHTLRLLQPQLDNRGITLNRELAAESDLVYGDEGELLQALMNLLLNAVEAMPRDGTLTVRTGNTNSPTAALRITISDTGVGIAPANLPHLFDPFFTTKPSGTGLGLAVTRGIIEEHHGNLTVESAVGKGAAFVLTLPLAPPRG
jgi:signal transduction histidine kinase